MTKEKESLVRVADKHITIHPNFKMYIIYTWSYKQLSQFLLANTFQINFSIPDSWNIHEIPAELTADTVLKLSQFHSKEREMYLHLSKVIYEFE